MRINKVQIVNFRGFEDKEVVFQDNVTVVIGDNTAGKTSLLHALQVALGAYLQSLKELPGSVDYRCNFRDTDRFLRYDAEKKDYFPNERLPRITVEGEFVQTFKQDNGGFRFEPCLISWYRELTRSNSTTHNHACAGELMDVVSQMVAQRREAGMNAVYPLVLSFGTNRIAAQVRLSRKVKERQQRIEKAYKSALLDKVDFVGALDWLERYDKSLKDGKLEFVIVNLTMVLERKLKSKLAEQSSDLIDMIDKAHDLNEISDFECKMLHNLRKARNGILHQSGKFYYTEPIIKTWIKIVYSL